MHRLLSFTQRERTLYLSLLLLFFASATSRVQGQECYPNLIPNPSFEEFDECPIDHEMVELYTPWFNPTSGNVWEDGINAGSSDAFNACIIAHDYSGPGNSVPNNWFGFQHATTGESYIGLGLHLSVATDYREYIEVPLTVPLESGKKYLMQFKVSLGDYSQHASDDIAAYFSQNPVAQPGSAPINVIPQIANPEGKFIKDTTSWTIVSDKFIASGGERYVTIGNFKNDANTTLFKIRDSNHNNSSYYYIDDVELYELDPILALLESPLFTCPGETVRLSASAAGAIGYSWSPATGLDDATSATPLASPDYTTLYTVTATLPNGCQVSNELLLLVDPISLAIKPSATHGYTPLKVNFLNESSGIEKYHWQFPGGEIIETASPSYTFSEKGNHTVTVETLSPSGCSLSASYTFETKDFFIPNIITPNGDGQNESFRVDLFDTWELYIYNRWGQNVFYSQHYRNDFTAAGLADGTYFYYLHNPLDGHKAKGFLTVLR